MQEVRGDWSHTDGLSLASRSLAQAKEITMSLIWDEGCWWSKYFTAPSRDMSKNWLERLFRRQKNSIIGCYDDTAYLTTNKCRRPEMIGAVTTDGLLAWDYYLLTASSAKLTKETVQKQKYFEIKRQNKTHLTMNRYRRFEIIGPPQRRLSWLALIWYLRTSSTFVTIRRVL